MTTYRQREYDMVINELREKEEKSRQKKETKKKELMVTRTMSCHPTMLSEKELQDVTMVFRSLESRLEEGTIHPSVLPQAMKSLGLNPSEQAVIDIPNHIGRNGLIYFADFCQLVLDWFREDDSQEEAFRQAMFRVMCGTQSYGTDFKAKKYKLKNHFLSKKEFRAIMTQLPVPVYERDVEEMFEAVDTDRDGKISYQEFCRMVNPDPPPEVPKMKI